ncbi:MAG: nucleotidyltransferase domain-containing protein [Candidatus Margulisbacteria bacterium]|nr:nucleotidyltransferase domain-containing protein [Candidatus Margulisiibacteriota bacterium]
MREDVREMVSGILRNHFTNGEKVYAFGSRARGTARKYSDLDLAVDSGDQSFDFSARCALKFDFEESDIPFRVDIIDLRSVTPEFKALIQTDFINLHY